MSPVWIKGVQRPGEKNDKISMKTHRSEVYMHTEDNIFIFIINYDNITYDYFRHIRVWVCRIS